MFNWLKNLFGPGPTFPERRPAPENTWVSITTEAAPSPVPVAPVAPVAPVKVTRKRKPSVKKTPKTDV